MPVPLALIAAGAQVAGGLAKTLIQRRRANQARLPQDDPAQALYLEELKRRQRAMEMGIDPTSQAGRQLIEQRGQSALNAARRVTGGDVGATIGALRNINRGTGRNISELLSRTGARADAMTGQIGQITGEMAKRIYQLGMADRLQALAEQKQAGKDTMANLMALAGRKDFSELLGSIGKTGANIDVAQAGAEGLGVLKDPLGTEADIPTAQTGQPWYMTNNNWMGNV